MPYPEFPLRNKKRRSQISDLIIPSSDAKRLQKAKYIFPQDRDWLWAYCDSVLGVRLSRVALAENAIPPLEIVAKLFFQEIYKAIIIGARGGGKTAISSTLHVLNSIFYPGCDTVHLSATVDQAQEGYRFTKKLINETFIDQIDGDPMKKVTQFKNGSIIRLLVGSKTGVNAPHAHKICIDEVDQLGRDNDNSWPARGIEIYNQLQGMALDDTDTIKVQKFYLSSWKRYLGMVSLLNGVIKSPDFPAIERNGIFIVTPLETMKKCDKDCKECAQILDPTKDRSFWDYCQGRARNADGWRSREVYLKNFADTPSYTWIAEYECQSPSLPNRVFPWFDPLSFRCVRECRYDPNLPLYLGVDFGFVDASVGVFAQKQGEIWVNLHEFYKTGMNDWDYCRNLLEYSKNTFGKVPDYVWADPAARSGRHSLTLQLIQGGHSTPVRYPRLFKKDKAKRVKFIKGEGSKGLIVNDVSCEHLNHEMLTYSWSGKTLQDGGDDAVDAFCYGYTGFKETIDSRQYEDV